MKETFKVMEVMRPEDLERTASLPKVSQGITKLSHSALLPPHPVAIYLIEAVLQKLDCLHSWKALFLDMLAYSGAGPSNPALDMILLGFIFTYQLCDFGQVASPFHVSGFFLSLKYYKISVDPFSSSMVYSVTIAGYPSRPSQKLLLHHPCDWRHPQSTRQIEMILMLRLFMHLKAPMEEPSKL